MSTVTLGTNANNSLMSIFTSRNPQSQAAKDGVSTINANVKNDQINGFPIWPGAFRMGLLYIPNRGVLQVLPGDYIGIDTTTGWPILVSSKAIASGVWTHT